MSLHPTFPLRLEQGAAQLILMPCPGTKEADLTSSLTQLKKSGVNVVITLMTSTELNELSLDISHITGLLGMDWFHLPIEDDCVPDADFSESWKTVGPIIHALLNKGEHVAIHCKGGSGRTGLVSGQILIERGEKLSLVIEKVTKLRSNAFKLKKHVDYIKAVENNAKYN